MADQHDFSAIGPEGALGRRLFVMTTRPVDQAARTAIKSGAMRQEHLAYIIGLEKAGVIFAGGPLLDDQDNPSGTGMIVLKADTLEEAKKLADRDPMHRDGLRSYSLRGWKVNEGSMTLTISFSDQRAAAA